MSDKYFWKEPYESKNFWSAVFWEVYEGDVDTVRWYENGENMDWKHKVDLSVITIKDQLRINYQVKNRSKHLIFLEVNLNVKQFNNYVYWDNAIEYFGFGFLKNNYAIIVTANSMYDFWLNYRSKYKIKGYQDQSYVSVPVQDLLDHTESMPVVLGS